MIGLGVDGKVGCGFDDGCRGGWCVLVRDGMGGVK